VRFPPLDPALAESGDEAVAHLLNREALEFAAGGSLLNTNPSRGAPAYAACADPGQPRPGTPLNARQAQYLMERLYVAPALGSVSPGVK
jgi:hypothetical protein